MPCVLLTDLSGWEVRAPQLCVSCPSVVLSGAEAVPGEACEPHLCPSSCQSRARPFPGPGEGPRPASSLSGHRPVTRLRRNNPAKRGPARTSCLKSSLSTPSPAAPLPLLRLSCSAVCSWTSLRRAPCGLPGQPHHSIARPVPSQAPAPPRPPPWPHQVLPRLRKPAPHFPPLRSPCAELRC